MAGETFAIRLRAADRLTLGQEATRRKQALQQFLTESLEVVAAGLRQAPEFPLTPEDVFARRPEPTAKPEQDYQGERPWRWRRLRAADSKA